MQEQNYTQTPRTEPTSSLVTQIKGMTYDSGPISIWVLASEQRHGAEGES